MVQSLFGQLLRGLTLIGTAVLAGFLLNALRPDGVVFSAAAPAQVCTAGALSVVEHLGPEQANALCGRPGVLIADARPAQQFAEGHVAGAVHLPCAASGVVAAGVASLLQGRNTVIVYAGTTAEAEAVADGLQRRNADPHLRVVVLDGGFAAWERAGLACVSGACVDCEPSP